MRLQCKASASLGRAQGSITTFRAHLPQQQQRRRRAGHHSQLLGEPLVSRPSASAGRQSDCTLASSLAAAAAAAAPQQPEPPQLLLSPGGQRLLPAVLMGLVGAAATVVAWHIACNAAVSSSGGVPFASLALTVGRGVTTECECEWACLC